MRPNILVVFEKILEVMSGPSRILIGILNVGYYANEKAGASSPERAGQTNVSNANVMAHVRRNDLDIGFIKSLIDLTAPLRQNITFFSASWICR